MRRLASHLLSFGPALWLALCGVCVVEPAGAADRSGGTIDERHSVDPATLLPNGHRPLPGLLTGGQPSADQVTHLATLGYEVVVSLRAPSEGAPSLAEHARSVGLTYVELPVTGPKDLDRERVAALGKLVVQRGKHPLVVFCATGNRAGAMLALEQAQVEGWPPEAALWVGQAAGLDQLEEEVRELLGAAARGGAAAMKSSGLRRLQAHPAAPPLPPPSTVAAAIGPLSIGEREVHAMPTIEDHLSIAEIRELQDRLETDRHAFVAAYEQDLERERGIPVDEVGDLADRAEAASDRETLLSAAESELDRLREIDDALRRMSDGTYGTCLAGGEPIPMVRLRAVPWTRYCAAHQEEVETAERRAGRRGRVLAAA